MKGAIGNALILNIVITFMLIFFSLLIGSMAYSKAYKTKDYLINMIDKYENEKTKGISFEGKWDDEVNEYLEKIGYPINKNICPAKEGYTVEKGDDIFKEEYDYCIYKKVHIKPEDKNEVIRGRYNYMVQVYMKFDFPILGDFIRIPITGETKSYNILR